MHDDNEGFLEVRIKGGWELDPDHPGCIRSVDRQLVVILDQAGFLILQRSQLEAWKRGEAVPTTPPFADLTNIPGINEGLASAAELAGIKAEIDAARKEGRDALFTTAGSLRALGETIEVDHAALYATGMMVRGPGPLTE